MDTNQGKHYDSRRECRTGTGVEASHPETLKEYPWTDYGFCSGPFRFTAPISSLCWLGLLLFWGMLLRPYSHPQFASTRSVACNTKLPGVAFAATQTWNVPVFSVNNKIVGALPGVV